MARQRCCDAGGPAEGGRTRVSQRKGRSGGRQAGGSLGVLTDSAGRGQHS